MTMPASRTETWSIGAASGPIARSRTRTVALWTAQIVSAGIFLLAGTSKLAGATAMVQTFDAIGIGQWFRYVTGSIEVVAAVLLLVPSLAFVGAVLLAVTMVGAILTHLFIIGGSPVPAILLLVLTTFVAWTRGREVGSR